MASNSSSRGYQRLSEDAVVEGSSLSQAEEGVVSSQPGGGAAAGM